MGLRRGLRRFLTLLCLLPTLAHAAFPETSPVLVDDFNRASIGSNWTVMLNSGINIEAGGLMASTNAVANSDDASYYNVKSYTGKTEAYATVGANGASGEWMAISLCNDTTLSTPDCYAVFFNTGGTGPDITYWRIDNGSYTQLGATETGAPQPGVGDKIGISYNPSTDTLQAHIFTGGAWSSHSTRSDATYNGPFYVALDVSFDEDSGGNAFDDLFAGSSNVEGCILKEDNSFFLVMEGGTDKFALEGGDGGLCTDPVGGGTTWPGWYGGGFY